MMNVPYLLAYKPQAGINPKYLPQKTKKKVKMF